MAKIKKHDSMLEDERFDRSSMRATVLARLEEGADDFSIRKSIKMKVDEFNEFKRECLQWAADAERGKSAGEVYLEYVLHQKKCLKDLESIISEHKTNPRSVSSIVGAVKARSDIYDRIVKVGQDFGILEKRPERKEIVAGVLVAKMDDTELKQTVLGELANLERMMESVMGQNILELPSGTLHRVGPKPGVVRSGKRRKGHKSKMNRLHKGRRVVKSSPTG